MSNTLVMGQKSLAVKNTTTVSTMKAEQLITKSRAKKYQAKNETTQAVLSDKLSKSLTCPEPGNVQSRGTNHT